MKLIRLLLIVLLVSLIFGQLARLPLGSIGGAVNLIDLVLVFTVLSWFLYLIFSKQKVLFPPGVWPLFIFCLLAFVSLVNAFKFFSPFQVLVGGLFLWRFIIYSMVYLMVYNCVTKEELPFWTNLLLTVGILVAFLGILQFVFLPDLRFLALYGWDPHLDRLVSTFLDPNFVGGFLTLTLFLLVSKTLFSPQIRPFDWFLIIFLSVAILLTFSRSTYLMLGFGLFLIGILKSRRLFFAFLIFSFLTVFFVPKVQERVIGALTIDATAQARIISWKNAMTVIADFPLLGVGFNTFRFAQARYGFFSTDGSLGGHSGAGSDSSFLTILATTGIFGFLFFLFLFLRIIGKSLKTSRKNYLSLWVVVSLLSLFIHSQFVNSLLFPLIIIWLWFTIGLSFASIRDEEI